jgi:hypothetical protein
MPAARSYVRVAAPALGGVIGAMAYQAVVYACHPSPDNVMAPVVRFVQHLWGAG